MTHEEINAQIATLQAQKVSMEGLIGDPAFMTRFSPQAQLMYADHVSRLTAQIEALRAMDQAPPT